MRSVSAPWMFLLGVALASGLGQSAAATDYLEPFGFDTATAGTAYSPPFTFNNGGGGTADVTGGVLHLLSTGPNNVQTFLRPGFAGAEQITVDVGASNSNGNYNVGLTIGGNNVVFHPGFGGAAFRVEGNGGFGNTSVGFTPANGSLHKLAIDVFPEVNLFHATLTDAANPANTFTRSFYNPASVGAQFGPIRSGQATGDGRFDNLKVSGPALMLHTMSQNSFSIPTADAAAFTATYPGFSTSLPAGGTASTSGGSLLLTTPAGGGASFATVAGFKGELVVTADVTALNSNGNYNVGLHMGQNDLVFHPGFGGGAFRVEGPGGFGNTNMGFTPANNTPTQMIVDAFDNGFFEVFVTDGTNIFHTSFSNPAWSALTADQRAIGFRVEGPNGTGIFDNLVIRQVLNTPEPASVATWTLGGLAAAGFAARRWRKRRPAVN